MSLISYISMMVLPGCDEQPGSLDPGSRISPPPLSSPHFCALILSPKDMEVKSTNDTLDYRIKIVFCKRSTGFIILYRSDTLGGRSQK